MSSFLSRMLLGLFAASLAGCGTPEPAKLRAYVPPAQQERVVYVGNANTQAENVERQSVELIRANYSIKRKQVQQNSYALIIGIANYQHATPVVYADYSAYAFKELATNTLGVPAENVLMLVNESATSGQIKSKVELLKELADKGSKVYVYYAGHGVPGRDGNSYLLPADMSADAIHLEPNLMLNSIYQRLAQGKASNIYVFVDSCFSGKDDHGELLYKGVAPLLRVASAKPVAKNLTVVTAGGASDFANDLEAKKQRMFTYYLIKALEGGATRIDSVFPQVQSQVKRASLMKGIGYKQVPELAGNTTASLY